MDLNSVVSPIVSAVNSPSIVGWQRSTGNTTAASGTRAPVYAPSVNITVQIQGMSEKEIAHLNALNIGGVLRKVYAEGEVASLIRASQKGGDLLTFNGFTWLVVHVMEQWADWCSVVAQQQAPQ